MTPQKLFDNYFDDYIHIFPSYNDFLNIPKYNYLKKEMPNYYSDEHKLKVKKLFKKYLNASSLLLKNNKKYSKKNLVYLKSLNYICKTELKGLKIILDHIPLTHDYGFFYEMFDLSSGNSYYLYEKKQDYDDFIKKIRSFPDIVDTIIQKMRIGIAKKIVLPKILSKKLLKQTVELLESKTYLNKKIKFKLDYDFNKKLECVFIDKTKEFIQFMKREYVPNCHINIGLCNIPDGIETYKILVESTLTKYVSIDKIHNFGISEVKRIHEEQNIIKDKLGFKGSLNEFNLYLRNRKDLKFKSKKDLIESYKKMYKQINNTIMKTMFSETIKNECEILPVPDYNEEYSSEAYYIPGDLFNKRKGQFFINLKNFKESRRIDIEALTLHEANPGHHFQLTQTFESSDIPLFIKNYNNDAYSEGWGLYCENLGEFKQLESYYGKLNMEMVRATRLVVDTGIHYYGWGFDKSVRYLKKFLFETDEQIKDHVIRYAAIPSQALSYKMGEKIILDLKRKYNGDIKKFHSKILKYGHIPLEILEREEFK